MAERRLTRSSATSPPSRSGSGSHRRRPATCTSATSARRCSTGRSPATTAAPWCCASRTPTSPATPPRATRRCIDSLRWLGIDWDEGPEVGGDVRPLPAVRAVRHLPRHRRAAARGRVGLRLLLHQRGGRGAPQGVRLQGPGVRRLLPRASPTSSAAAFEAEGRTPGRAPPDARPADHLRRPRPRRGHLPARARARLRARARQRRPALHAGQPGRRRADGDHPRAARRGPALLARRARSRSTRRSRRSASAAAPPRFGHLPIVMGEGNKRLSKRDAGLRPARVRRARLPARGPAQLPRPARLGDRRGPRRVHDGRRWPRPSTSAGSTPTPRAST